MLKNSVFKCNKPW